MTGISTLMVHYIDRGTRLQTGYFIPGGGLLSVGKEHDGIHGQKVSSDRFVGRLSQVCVLYAIIVEEAWLHGKCSSVMSKLVVDTSVVVATVSETSHLC